jgi:prolipoprotein diacylglyceryltransferase/protein-S-isoprenylcysteine O-methyltransferase Ste14
MNTRAAVARAAYAGLFAIALPALLAAWGVQLDALVTLPAYGSPAFGWPIAVAGLALMLAATRDLWVIGGGLPASPFPPKTFVRAGIYGIVAHPIYVGAVLAAFGVAIATRSGGGLWIVTPTLTLAIVAWVIGFERSATLARFGPQPAPLLSLPPASDEPPAVRERLAFFFVVVLPWVASYLGVELLGVPRDAVSTYTRWDAALPVRPWTEAIYFSTYLLVMLAPFVARTRHDLRRLSLDGIWATLLIVPLYLMLPFVADAKPVTGDGLWSTLLRFERADNASVTAFPAFHVVWAAIAAAAIMRRWRELRWPLVALVAATAVSCVTTGMHSVADVVAGGVAYVAVRQRAWLWNTICVAAEHVANSWREATVGPVRFLNHGVYAATGIVLANGVAVALVGIGQLSWIIGMTLVAIVGAALWAQIVEGSPHLLRPYGYFGSVIATIVFAAVVSAVHGNGWQIVTAFGIGTAFGQPVGRLRCLVQGCCHGSAAGDVPGIRYLHPQSRVVRLSSLGGVPVHPTPLYSGLWTLVVAGLLCRLWSVQAPLSFIVGAYFILVGAGRFVEEHFRGEPQTRVVGGMRMYQWLAIAMLVSGGAITTLHSPPSPTAAGFDPAAIPALLILWLVSYAAYGVDFPGSSRRLSRLA